MIRYEICTQELVMDASRLSVVIPAEMAEIINAAVEKGQYATTSEIVREALRDWSDKQFLRQRKFEEIRAAIRQGIEDGKAGRTVSMEEAFAEFDKIIADVAKE